MNKPAIAVTIAIASLCLSGCDIVDFPNETQSQGSPTSKVIRVVDGDTLVLAPTPALPANQGEDEHVVRLLGIDTPELNSRSAEPPQCGARAATQALEALLKGNSEVTVVPDSSADATDRYGRTLAHLETTDGTDLALAMITAGNASAWVPSGEPEPDRYQDYEQAQDSAEHSGRGLHARCASVGRS